MTRRLALLAAVAVALAGCGGSDSTPTTATTAATGATTRAQTTVRTFFYRDSALVPVAAGVPETRAVAQAALEQLLAGPPDGYVTTIPAGARLTGVSIADGVATAAFSSELGSSARTAQAQIVSTLMQFPTVHGVKLEVAGKPVSLQDGSGTDIEGPATGADYVDLTALAPIFVRVPARDSTVSSPVHAAGTADVFEATFVVETWSGGKRVGTKTITATSGSGTRGTWTATLSVPNGDVKLLFYEPSAKDGSPLHETVVLLHVT
jgi:Sporulation and spore germination/Immunoglobulin-like domain of bacterial spore germination